VSIYVEILIHGPIDDSEIEGLIGFGFPGLFSGFAEVCEWFEDDDERFHIEVNVRNRVWRPLFGYRGSFDVE
jgi:hypothetical protein